MKYIPTVYVFVPNKYYTVLQKKPYLKQIIIGPGFSIQGINRPGVGEAVLQSPLSINKVSHPLVQISAKHCQSQTGKARELKFERMFIPNYVSCVMCKVTRVTCHFFLFILKKNIYIYFFLSLNCFGKKCGATRWRVCYQRGLSRLVCLL